MRKLMLMLAPLVSTLAFAQSGDVHHNNITVGIGPGIPTGNSTSYLSAAPMLGIHYGYRFDRYFQADAGVQIAFGAANNQNAEVTDLGTMQGGDREYMVPLGGRVIIPLPFRRIEASVGGGTVYLHYSETAPSNPYYQVYCYSCTARSGWGGYGLANISYFLDSNQNFHVGVTFQYVAASTSGAAVGDVPALKTTDHWANIAFEFGLSF